VTDILRVKRGGGRGHGILIRHHQKLSHNSIVAKQVRKKYNVMRHRRSRYWWTIRFVLLGGGFTLLFVSESALAWLTLGTIGRWRWIEGAGVPFCVLTDGPRTDSDMEETARGRMPKLTPILDPEAAWPARVGVPELDML
jgi:hypothetical protein